MPHSPRPLFITVLCLILPVPLTAQVTFERTYGDTANDGGQSVEQAADGGYFVTGHTFSQGGSDIWIIGTDLWGEVRWAQLFGGLQDDYGFGVAATADGGCLAAGYLMNAGQADVALHRNAADGTPLWMQVFGGGYDDMAYAAALNSDGGFIVAGATYSFGSGRPNAYVIRTDSLGDTLWTRAYGGTSEDYAFSVWQTSDSGFIVGGTTYSYGAGQSDVYLVRTDARGDTEWTRAYGGPGNEHGHSVKQTADGGCVICGTTYSFGAGDADIWLVRADATGDTLWTRTFGGDSGDFGHSVAETPDHGFILCGQTASFGAGSYDGWLIRTDSLGETLWTRTFGGSSDDRAFSAQRTADGGCVLAGVTNSFGAGRSDAWLIKTDSLGRVGIAEPEPPSAGRPSSSVTVCRGSLLLPSSPITLHASLFSLSGREVTRLHPGPNDLRHLPAGVYFVRAAGAGQPLRGIALVR